MLKGATSNKAQALAIETSSTATSTWRNEEASEAGGGLRQCGNIFIPKITQKSDGKRPCPACLIFEYADTIRTHKLLLDWTQL
jgi:hypothetical protein